ncbi:MAG TPA: pilus assembly PilX N-terminal domain-containing protein [bacterium]|nr:pilus assembly PilX N-terminal domain-containing protein [bacterium]
MKTRIRGIIGKGRERGVAMVVTLMAIAVMGFVGASFSLMLMNETRSANSNVLAQQALYVAESGIQDVLFQRSKRPADMCFPYFFHDDALTAEERLQIIDDLTGAKSGSGCGEKCEIAGRTVWEHACNPVINSIPSAAPATAELPCWPYNEQLYANYIHFGPDYKCNDGSDNTDCPDYDPLFYWPANGDGSMGWKDWSEVVSATTMPLANQTQSSGARYTTGFFTLCNDDFEGIQPGETGFDLACEEAQDSAGTVPCAQYVIRLSIVSVGEVQAGPNIVRRAVKSDLAPPSLYSGVVDKYVDMTLMWQTDINGPIHVNGWWDGFESRSFLAAFDLAPAAFFTILDPPEMVSLSYPEPPGGDWQPSDILGISLSHDIVYVHLPVRIEIPQVNWAKWEDRMNALYLEANNLYSDASKVMGLRYCKFGPAGSVTSTLGDCGDAGEQYVCDNSGNALPDDCLEPSFPKFISTMNPGPSPYNVAFDGTAQQPNRRRIHNVNRNTYQLWHSGTEQVFDLFDQWDEHPDHWVKGEEPAHIPGASADGHRDKSLQNKVRFVLDPHFDIGCLACVIMGGINLDNFVACCVGKSENRYAFAFMGRHEFRDFVFIDGVMGVGFRSPYHSCGTEDGALGIYCIVVPEICPLEWLLDPFGAGPGPCIPSWKIGLPHWHLGSAMVTGEVLVNGRTFMADWIRIEGGTIYSDGHIIKDESSGYDMIIRLDQLVCWILGLAFGGALTIDIIPGVLEVNICDVIFAVLNPIIGGLVPWWPEMNLTNNELIDFATYLDINGTVNTYATAVNPGTLYTRGDFRLLEPGWDAASMIFTTVLKQFLPFLEIVPAMDPIRIWNGGAIVAGGTARGAPVVHNLKDQVGTPFEYYEAYQHGNIYLTNNRRADILTYNPNTDERSVGYVMARGGLSVWGDIISNYGMVGLIDSCSLHSVPLSEDCQAAGIFYSGGISAGSDPYAMFSRRGGDLSHSGFEYNYSNTCKPLEDPEFLNDPLGDLGCWLGGIGDILGGSNNEFNIRGHVFAGAVGASPGTHMRLDQDGSVRHDAVVRQYFGQLGGIPIDWMEVGVPGNLPFLPTD